MIGSLCSGYGGLEMGVAAVFGDPVAWHAELDPAASVVLAHRYPGVANHGDITTTDWTTVEPVDVLCAGFPCQPVSTAGKRKVTGDARWLWPHIAHAVRVLRPRHVVLENVSGLLAPWRDGPRWAPAPIEEVVGDLAAVGYDATWRSVRASDVGAPHRRQRVFIVATDTDRRHGWGAGDTIAGDRRPAAPRGGPAQLGGRRGAPADADVAGLEKRVAVRSGRGQRLARSGGVEAAADAAGPARGGSQQPALGSAEGSAAELGERLGAPIWGPYGPPIARWEQLTGRPAPPATDDRRRLSPRFVEWMMGLPDGWVTDIGISRSQQLKILGNGVVPQQAAYAVGSIVERDVAA